MCFPVLFLVLAVIAFLPPSIFNIMVVIGITRWTGIARYARAESTVRGWCAARKLPGAFKLHGAEWRVPESSLVKFDENQSFGGGPALGQGRPVDIASWRREGAG